MTVRVEIRAATPEDEPAVRCCAQEAYQQYVAAIGRKPAPMVADFGSAIQAGNLDVAISAHDEVLGFIVHYLKANVMFLENIAVRPANSGQGIGKKLIAHCECKGKRLGANSIQLYTNQKMTANLSMYPHLGFKETGRQVQDGFNRVFFEKRLSS